MSGGKSGPIAAQHSISKPTSLHAIWPASSGTPKVQAQVAQVNAIASAGEPPSEAGVPESAMVVPLSDPPGPESEPPGPESEPPGPESTIAVPLSVPPVGPESEPPGSGEPHAVIPARPVTSARARATRK